MCIACSPSAVLLRMASHTCGKAVHGTRSNVGFLLRLDESVASGQHCLSVSVCPTPVTQYDTDAATQQLSLFALTQCNARLGLSKNPDNGFRCFSRIAEAAAGPAAVAWSRLTVQTCDLIHLGPKPVRPQAPYQSPGLKLSVLRFCQPTFPTIRAECLLLRPRSGGESRAPDLLRQPPQRR